MTINTDAINDAIRVMERVRDNGYRLDMHVYVDCITPNAGSAKSRDAITSRVKALIEEGAPEQEISECGTAACFIGWYALSPEGRARGLRIVPMAGFGVAMTVRIIIGNPRSPTCAGASDSLMHVLDIDRLSARRLMSLGCCDRDAKGYYPSDCPVTAEAVVDALRCLRELGKLGPTLESDLAELAGREMALPRPHPRT